jgi:hypothetical protein
MASTKKKSVAKKAKTTRKQAEPAPEVVKEIVETSKQVISEQSTPFSGLLRWNKWLAIIHAFQGLCILVLSDNRLLPVTTNYLTPNPLTDDGALVSATRHLFDVNVAWLIAGFFFMSAIAHTLMATVYRRRYEAELSEGMNRLRWLEYAVSASTMMVAIGFLSGVYDAATLVAIFALTGIMNLMGLAMEVYNRGKAVPNWLAYGIGCLAGIVPWLIVGWYAIAAAVYGDGHVPAFVYWIYGSMFVLFSSFAVNMWLQYRKQGKWHNYLYGERCYMILSLIAKTVLAWQVFAGLLRP